MLRTAVFDNDFNLLIDANQELKCIADVHGFAEGFIWSEKEQDLTFNSMDNEKTWRWNDETGKLEQLRSNTNIANGMAYASNGSILICEHRAARVSRANRDFSNIQVIATKYNGKILNSPNDIVVSSNGMIYFTDPSFGLRPSRHGRFRKQYQSCQGIYCINPDTLEVNRVADVLDNPNGLCFSPDERKIYFAESTTMQITVMDIGDNEMLVNRRLFAKTLDLGKGKPDGIKIDIQGNIWCAAQGGIQVFNQSGKSLGVLLTPDACGNFCFGGRNMNTIFFGSNTEVYAVNTKVKGIPLRR